MTRARNLFHNPRNNPDVALYGYVESGTVDRADGVLTVSGTPSVRGSVILRALELDEDETYVFAVTVTTPSDLPDGQYVNLQIAQGSPWTWVGGGDWRTPGVSERRAFTFRRRAGMGNPTFQFVVPIGLSCWVSMPLLVRKRDYGLLVASGDFGEIPYFDGSTMPME